LINNDAYPAKRAQFQDITTEEFTETLDNLTVFPFTLTRLVVDKMRNKNKGKIVFITSAIPFRPPRNYASYVIARAATNSMAQVLAQELAEHNIQVNAVAPNFIESPTYFPPDLINDPKAYAKIIKPIPLKRLGTPEEPAHFVEFLVSSKADYITGQVFPFAGGWV